MNKRMAELKMSPTPLDPGDASGKSNGAGAPRQVRADATGNDSEKTYAITRHRAAIDAWCWRVHFRRKGKLLSKTFYDLACGGTSQAMAMAIAWRDEKLTETEPLSMAEFHVQKRSNNVSGVPGVHFHKSAVQPLGFWQATIKVRNSRVRTKSFSVRKHGNDEAFGLAVAAREKMLSMVQDRPYLYNPVAKKVAARGNTLG
jgi:hypothetical protein